MSTEVTKDVTVADNATYDNHLQFEKLEGNKHQIVCYGHVIPNIIAHQLTEAEVQDQGYQEDPDQWHLVLDGRFGKTFSRKEMHKMAWFLANAMAVSAGFTRFGEYSTVKNPFQQASAASAGN